MVRNVAPLIQELEAEDFYLLSGLEHGMRFSEWVDRRKLPKYAEIDAEEVDYRLDRCLDLDLIERRTIQYEGYQLCFEGYDALALRTFSERETLSGVGAPLGEGKESDVFEAHNGTTVALKLHREGLTNFREVRRGREYTSDRDHVSWLYTARKAAELEYKALETLYPATRVPEPIDQNRHALIMERMDGVELSRADLPSERIAPLLTAIVNELATAYDLGLVHTDISEYNIFVQPDGPTIFDWPQSVPTDHPNADELLERDVTNLIAFFERKYPSALDSDLEIATLVDDIRSN